MICQPGFDRLDFLSCIGALAYSLCCLVERNSMPEETQENWLRGLDLNQRPSGYEPDELPGCSTPRRHHSESVRLRQTTLCSGDGVA